MKPSLRLLVAGLATMAAAGPVYAEFPERNIENIYPWAPGATMAASQVIADAMGQELGVNIAVVSTPGAGGVKAFETALSKPADGYTIIDGYVAPLVIQPIYGNAGWSYADFIPLWSATSNGFAFAVRKDEDRFQTLPELFAYAKDHPGELRYSPGTVGALPHLAAAKAMQSADAPVQMVPYPEIDNALRDMRGGILDFIITNPGVYAINKEDMKILAVMSDQEEASTAYGGAPLIASFGIDIGMTDLSPVGWNWWLVQKDTPEDVVARLREAMGAALARPAVQEKLLEMGYIPTGFPPEAYETVVAKVQEQLESAVDAIAWEKEKTGNP